MIKNWSRLKSRSATIFRSGRSPSMIEGRGTRILHAEKTGCLQCTRKQVGTRYRAHSSGGRKPGQRRLPCLAKGSDGHSNGHTNGHRKVSLSILPDNQGETQQPQEQIIEEIIYPEQHSEDGQQQQQQPQDASPASNRGRIGFIGAGQMGEALICGFLNAGMCTPDRISVSVRSEERSQRMHSLGVQVFGDATLGGSAELAKVCDIIFLSVKPQYLDRVLESLNPHVTERHLIVSIAAGVRIASLEANLPPGSRVIRVMPNTPCLIGQAASAFVLGNNATGEDAEKVFALISSCGLAVNVEERMMDAVTGLSGSGPAYVFLFLEALADGAVAAGLPREKAMVLAAQTVAGAARMVLESSSDGTLTHPALLKDRVSSPAGTTIAGLTELESAGMRGIVMRAVRAAAKRSEDMG